MNTAGGRESEGKLANALSNKVLYCSWPMVLIGLLLVWVNTAEAAQITYLFDFEVTGTLYTGSDPAFASLLPAVGSSESGVFTYDPTTPGVVISPERSDYPHSPAGSNGVGVSFSTGLTWACDPSEDFNVLVFDRPVPSADVIKFDCRSSAFSVPGLTHVNMFVQFVDIPGDALTGTSLPSAIDLSDWNRPNNVDFFARAPGNKFFRVFGKITDLQLAPPPVIEITLEIKPGSDPNSINLKSNGLIPVAILSDENFDALTQIDPDPDEIAKIAFGPNGASPAHGGHIGDVDGDGDFDVVLHFETQETGIASDAAEACLTEPTMSGTPMLGCDDVRVVPGSSKGKAR